MKAEHYNPTDETIYRAFEEMTDLTEQEQPKSHTKFYGDGSAWTTWPMGEPSKATADMEKTKHLLARQARQDPAPEMSDDEVYAQLKAMSNWEE